MSEFSDAYAVCPFYVTTSKKYAWISCEGITEDNYTMLSFRKKPEERAVHKEKYCDKDFKACPIYRMLQAKYE